MAERDLFDVEGYRQSGRGQYRVLCRHISHVVSTDCMLCAKEKRDLVVFGGGRFCDSGLRTGLYTTPTKRKKKKKRRS